MDNNQVSRTALWAAYTCDYHVTHDNPKILEDNFACHFITQENHIDFEKTVKKATMLLKHLSSGGVISFLLKIFVPKYLSQTIEFFASKSPGMFSDPAGAKAFFMQYWMASPLILSRARYAEDCLEKAVKKGVKQYVVLGAGMDSFAFRRPELLGQLQVYEIDYPATQDFKRRRLVELGWELPSQLHFIPVDFSHDVLAAALKRSSFDTGAQTFFSWLGVTYYLTRDEVLATLQDIAKVAPVGSKVVFDYFDNDAFIPEKVTPRTQGIFKIAEQAGEPMKAGFDPATLAAELAGLGLRLQENLNPTDIEKGYFQGRTDYYHALEHAHFACAVVE